MIHATATVGHVFVTVHLAQLVLGRLADWCAQVLYLATYPVYAPVQHSTSMMADSKRLIYKLTAISKL